ncbi:DUF2868 domain-containing protein [Pokkaliibacter sp. CJK22405]|uniref:DUF2868 domain-containing protein n=1 Tax=Pokkaliibacter sp. CJK22405 TaxID=3384615 RepID=UPI00398478DF
MSQHSLLRLLLDFDWQCQRDQGMNPALHHQRDRRIGMSISPQMPAPRQIATWLTRLHPDQQALPGEDGSRRLVMAGWALALIGLIVGILTMTGILAYDGSQRINLFWILGFIGLQLIFTLLAAWACFRDLKHPPILSSGRLVFLLGKLTSLDSSNKPLHLGSSHLKGLTPYLLLRYSQFFTTAFSLGALLCLLAQVTFQDLAFGWSTTLAASADTMHSLFSVIAAPWGWAFPDASPSLSMVEQSQYFRLAGAQASTDNPALLGSWWAFLALSWLIYGLIPRAIVLALVEKRWQRQLNLTLAKHPGFHPLFRRLHKAWIDTSSASSEESNNNKIQGAMAITLPKLESARVIHWADAGHDHPDLQAMLPFQKANDSYCAGGGHSLEQDEAVIEAFSQQNSDPIIIVVKAWEPPLAELQDFLLDLRNLNPDAPLYLLPINPGKKLEPADLPYLQQWQRFVAAMQDEHFYLVEAQADEAA